MEAKISQEWFQDIQFNRPIFHFIQHFSDSYLPRIFCRPFLHDSNGIIPSDVRVSHRLVDSVLIQQMVKIRIFFENYQVPPEFFGDTHEGLEMVPIDETIFQKREIITLRFNQHLIDLCGFTDERFNTGIIGFTPLFNSINL